MLEKILPHAYLEKIEDMLIYSGSKKDPENFIEKAVLVSLAAGLGAALLFQSFFLIAFGVAFIFVFLMMHGFLILAVEKRSHFVESILPDALQLMAANIKSGFIPSRAMLLSARKEFGPLSDAIKQAGKEMMTGKSLQEALSTIPKTIKSTVLDNTISLIIRGVRSGGQLVSLFEETAIDIRRKESIKKEVKANILMYGIFIGFAGCVGAPALYALSSYLVTTISRLGAVAQVPEDFQSRLPLMKFGQIDISGDFLLWFSIAAIVITTLFGGLIIGIIDSGKEKSGIKYMPIMMLIGLAVFFVGRILVTSMFGTLIPE
jgi:archaellum biogenesis protein FlaJ (TadC family)